MQKYVVRIPLSPSPPDVVQAISESFPDFQCFSIDMGPYREYSLFISLQPHGRLLLGQTLYEVDVLPSYASF